jgi:hypothetical protein
MSRCPEPKSDADVRSLLRGDDLNPVQCLASAGCLLGGFGGMSDRSLSLLSSVRLVVLGLRGGGRRSWVKLRTICWVFWGESFTCVVPGAGSLKSSAACRLFPEDTTVYPPAHRQRQRHQLNHHINHPLRKSPPLSNPPTLPSTTPPALAMMRNIINYSYPCLKITVETLFTL